MTPQSNYMTVSSTCYQKHGSEYGDSTRKDEISAIIYPVLGTIGAAYQLYLLLFG